MSEAINRTGYPSIDKPWNRYFNTIDGGNTVEVPTETIYNYLKKCNADNLDGYALDFFGHKITYGELFDRVEKVAVSMRELGVQEDEIVSIISVGAVEAYELMYACNRAGAVFDFISCLADHKALVHYFQDNESRKVFVLDLFADKVIKAAKEAGYVDQIIVFDLADEMPAITKFGYKLKTRKQDKSFYNDPMVMKYKDFKALSEAKLRWTSRKTLPSPLPWLTPAAPPASRRRSF